MLFTYQICRILKIPAILYNQSPLWEDKIKNDLPHRIVRRLTPAKRITPVLGVPGADKVAEPGACYVPFVMKPMLSPDEKQYCRDGKIRVFSVGKYEKRKNHRMLIEIIDELSEYPLHLTIAGECAADFHKDYYHELKAYIKEHGLSEKITLLKNLNREQLNAEYQKADFFVIPSTLEPASVSQLEAMAFALPVICSDTNGTACYVESAENGYLFADNQKESLKAVIEKMIIEPSNIAVMGKCSYELVKEKYRFESYLEAIMTIYYDITVSCNRHQK
jgi:glycosyltransferase involved in cell wall biosynthesis